MKTHPDHQHDVIGNAPFNDLLSGAAGRSGRRAFLKRLTGSAGLLVGGLNLGPLTPFRFRPTGGARGELAITRVAIPQSMRKRLELGTSAFSQRGFDIDLNFASQVSTIGPNGPVGGTFGHARSQAGNEVCDLILCDIGSITGIIGAITTWQDDKLSHIEVYTLEAERFALGATLEGDSSKPQIYVPKDSDLTRADVAALPLLLGRKLGSERTPYCEHCIEACAISKEVEEDQLSSLCGLIGVLGCGLMCLFSGPMCAITCGVVWNEVCSNTPPPQDYYCECCFTCWYMHVCEDSAGCCNACNETCF